jgi:hypothetical protein
MEEDSANPRDAAAFSEAYRSDWTFPAFAQSMPVGMNLHARL